MATSYLSPGVYVEEVDRGPKPLASVGTSTAAFLGALATGPVDEPVLVTNWSEFERTFGPLGETGHLGHAVYGFFHNGGSQCFVVNVGLPDEPAPAPARKGKASAGKGKDGGGDAGEAASPPPSAPGEARHKALVARFLGADRGPGARSGIHCLEDVDDVQLVCAPGQTDPAVWEAVLSHCERARYRFAILDCPLDLPRGGLDKLPRPRASTHGAVYFPWIAVQDPNEGRILVPPSGHVAGIYARSDAARGVHKAPAGEVIRGALGVRYRISRAEQDRLNPRGINCIRSFGDAGLRVWGARTLSDETSWRYVNVRRLFNMVEETIERGTRWVVFEPNDASLWARIRREVSAFLRGLWEQGALVGRTPAEAFFVKCDAETNPPESVQLGKVVIEVGLAPVRPAEFVVFRIGQMAEGGDATA